MNILTYILKMNDQMSSTLKKVGVTSDTTSKKVSGLKKEVKALDKTSLNGVSTAFSGFLKSISPIIIITAGIVKLKQAIGQSEDAYKKHAVAERQLSTVMRNTMSATDDEIKSILKLTSVQQKMGVIGDAVQLAGAQELSTYLTKAESLKKLIPVQNDMLAQQYGLNATQEQAVNIGSMLGKVMDGQVGALSRYGYKFDAAQEKILKYGKESQRVAVLVDVVTSAVGGMNKSLSETMEGKDQQGLNDTVSTMERMGKAIMKIKFAFSPVVDFFMSGANRIIDVFEKNESTILSFVSILSGVVIKSIQTLGSVISWVYSGFKTFMDGLRNGSPIFVTITGIIVALTAAVVGYKLAMLSLAGLQMVIAGIKSALVAYEIVVFAIKNATSLWTAAQWLLNVALNANPVGLIIAGVVALIALIAFLIIKIDGWGETWDNVVKFCTLVFDGFKSNLELKWLQIQNFFMDGLETIEKGWYKLQSLWNEDAANAGLSKLEAQRNERAKNIAETQQKIESLNNQIANLDVIKLKMNNTSLSDIAKGIKNKLGISIPGIPGTTMTSGGVSDLNASGGAGNDTANSIATGGTKTTHITINLGKLVETISINKSGFRESEKELEDKVLDTLTRVLSMSQGQI